MAQGSKDEGRRSHERSVLLSESEAAQAAHLLKILLATGRVSETEPPASTKGEPAIDRSQLEEIARRFFFVRKARHDFLPRRRLREQAWDMLLALYARASADQATNVVEIVKLGGASLATGIRYLEQLEKSGLIHRRPSKTDQRMVEIQLTAEGLGVMDSYFTHLIEAGLATPGTNPNL